MTIELSAYTMASDKVGTTIRAHCSNCGGERNCEIRGHHPEKGGDENFDWQRDWYLLTCRGCDHVFAQTISTNSEDRDDYYDHYGEHVTEYNETVETWPARSKRPIPDWFNNAHVQTDIKNISALNASIDELYRALDADLLVLSSIAIRTTFDIAAVLLGVKADLGFEKKIEALVNEGHIPEEEKENVGILVNAGSASAHRGWKPQPSDIDTLMSGLEDFIYNSMVLPARKRAQAAKLAALNASVPARPKKAARPKSDVSETKPST